VYQAICILEEGSRGCNISVCREGSGGFEINQWHQGLGDGGIDEMDLAGLVLGTSPCLTWWRRDIIIVVNDGRSRCCGFWNAVGGGNEGCVNGWELHREWVPNVNWFFVNDVQAKWRWQLDWLNINGNWYWGSFTKEYVMESCNGVKFVRGRLLDSRDSICKVSGGSDDLIDGCDDGYSHGMVLGTKCVAEMFAACSSHDGANAVVVFQ
jgi:hypothetical protein